MSLDNIPDNEISPSSRALPASWYTSPEHYELERRAIFSRKWLLTTHTLRFSKTGDWLRFNIAGFSFILVRDKEGVVNGFHNVCRHRAFPVVTEDKGTSRIFSCKYHGWSYGLNGKLAKAPGYQDLEGFDKSKNGLLPIHAHTDANGFIWVNLDGSENPEFSWEDDLEAIQFPGFDLADYIFDYAGEMEGAYNWKIMATNFDRGSHADPSDGGHQTSSIFQDPNATAEQLSNSMKHASTNHFLGSLVTILPNFIIVQRCEPASPTSSSLRYEVYRKKECGEEDLDTIHSMFKRLVSEDKARCEHIQQHLDDAESITASFHDTIQGLVTEFRLREEAAGHEIWPARQILPSEAKTSREDVDFCSRLQNNNHRTSEANFDCSSQISGCSGSVACPLGNPALAY